VRSWSRPNTPVRIREKASIETPVIYLITSISVVVEEDGFDADGEEVDKRTPIETTMTAS
jgi:hypothetical protein